MMKSKGIKPKHFESDVTMADVNFCYPTRPLVQVRTYVRRHYTIITMHMLRIQVLNQLNISVSPGQTLALVGPSGCGKSTIVQLIQRFYDASEGKVKYKLCMIFAISSGM